jgi:hypothetical protein
VVKRLLAVLALVPAIAVRPHLDPNPPVPPTPNPIQEVALVQPWPDIAHGGDTIYLSGSGFQPHTRLYFATYCPSWVNGDSFRFGNYSQVPVLGPKTDGNGTFAGYPVKALTLKVVPTSTCQVYTNYLNTQYGVADINAIYRVIPRSEKLPSRATHISGTLNVHPKQIKAGLSETIDISRSWGGALADVSLLDPRGHPIERSLKLNYQGAGRLHVLIDSHSVQPGHVTVSVKFHLGSFRGSKVGSFMVVR